jgi:hypothetical protein
MNFLGIIWQKGHLQIPSTGISGFKNILPPSTPRKLKAALEAISVYKNFIPRFDKYAHLLLEQRSAHHKQFCWSRKHQKAFNYLTNAIGHQTSLNSPDPLKPFFVQSDASDAAGAGCIFQRDDQGQELLLACVSSAVVIVQRKIKFSFFSYLSSISMFLYSSQTANPILSFYLGTVGFFGENTKSIQKTKIRLKDFFKTNFCKYVS